VTAHDSSGATAGEAPRPAGAHSRFSYYGHRLPDSEVRNLHDHLVCKDNTDGSLIVRRHTERYVPVPRKAAE
jgi:hypothetical protein